MDPKQAGLAETIKMIALTLSELFWGYLADRCKNKLRIIVTQNIMVSLFLFSSPWVAYWINTSELLKGGKLHMHGQDVLNKTDGNISILSPQLNFSQDAHHFRSGSQTLFLSMTALGVGSALFGGGRQVLFDIKIVTMTKQESKSSNAFGRQRLWGSVAYSVMPLFMGLYLENTTESPISPYLPVFIVYILVNTLNLVSCLFLFKKRKIEAEKYSTNENKQNTYIDSGIWKVLSMGIRDYNFGLLFFTVLCIGLANGLQWCFQFIFMDEMGGSKVFMGLCVLSQCGMEVLIFPFAAKITQKIGGNKAAMIVGFFGYGISYCSYYFVKSYQLLTVFTCFLGFTYTLYFCAVFEELYKISNDNCRATIHAIYNSVFSGVGNAVAGIAGGTIYKLYGGRTMFLFSGIIYLAIGTMFIFLRLLIAYKQKVNAQRSYCQLDDLHCSSQTTSSKADIPKDLHCSSQTTSSLMIPKENDDAVCLSDDFETVNFNTLIHL